jgi:hypothetical protein
VRGHADQMTLQSRAISLVFTNIVTVEPVTNTILCTMLGSHMAVTSTLIRLPHAAAASFHSVAPESAAKFLAPLLVSRLSLEVEQPFGMLMTLRAAMPGPRALHVVTMHTCECCTLTTARHGRPSDGRPVVRVDRRSMR